ncbi:MAG: rubrerythrin family protein [Firmicutes bacterium]|nr:rubrerythrin family protein [Bacillota bacterium]
MAEIFTKYREQLKGTKTEQNLHEAFAGQSMARNKYWYFASVAKKEGYEQIAEIFTKTAENEKEHAKMWFKFLGGIGNTLENLKAAAKGENYEWTDMYARMEKEARADGFEEIANLFKQVGAIEKAHEERYLELIKQVEKGTVFQRTKEVIWECRNCHHLQKGKEPPALCPTCFHPKAYFEVQNTHWKN